MTLKTRLQAGVVGLGWLLALLMLVVATVTRNLRTDMPVIAFMGLVMSMQTFYVRRRAQRERAD